MSSPAVPTPFDPDPPALEVVEKDTDTSWALFQALTRAQHEAFERTRPTALEPAVAPEPAAGAARLEDALAEMRRNNRICPLPPIWEKLYDYLPNKTADLPRVPTPQEWPRQSAMHKRAFLRLHIEWAERQGVLQQVHKALKALPEDRWCHMGE